MQFIISINGHFISVRKSTTILQACESVGCFIPRFCYQSILNIAGNCRMCLVSVYGSGKPVASCTVLVSSGIAIYTTRFFVRKARESVLEFLLLNHPLDCPVCDQGGICDLQEQSFAFGIDRSRFFSIKRRVVDKYLGPVISTIINRCIQCTRCVRFLGEHTGSFWGSKPTLVIAGRGLHSEITTYSLTPLLDTLSGNIIDLCPVGALTKKPYAFIGRPWERRVVVSCDLSRSSIDKVYFSTLVDGALFVSVRSMNGCWISNQTRFSYDALGFAPSNSVIPSTFKLPSTGSIFLGSDLSLFDLLAISFYFDGLPFDTTLLSPIPLVDKTRPSLWGITVLGCDTLFSSFDFILLVGAGVAQVAPSVFAGIREAFCSGSFIASFGPIGVEFIVVPCGNRFSDFIRFVLGYHRCCLFFSFASRPLILLSTSLFSAAYRALWSALVDKLRFFGCFIRFINTYANEVAYFYGGPFGVINSLGLSSELRRSISIFGYIGVSSIEFLWVNSVSIEFYCGSWPISSRSYQRLPLRFQSTIVCTPYGEVVPTTPLVASGRFSTLFDYSVNDILILTFGVKYWSVPLFIQPKIFVFGLGWVEPLDFQVKLISFNCLVQHAVDWTSLVSWVERSYVRRQFQLFREYVWFNFLLWGCFSLFLGFVVVCF
jgi:hypothetical protein